MTILENGLIDCTYWNSTYEGPFTRLAKLGVVNGMNASELCTRLFGRKLLVHHARPFHGRSLISCKWMNTGKNVHSFASSIGNSALEQACGRWAQWISSDLHFRYCPVCLDQGFQSAIFQIDALLQCPVHKTPILNTCTNCGEKTTAYALTEESFRSPMHCHHCLFPLSEAWRCGQDLSLWQVLQDQTPFQDMQRWLTDVVQAKINWPEVDSWYAESGPEVWRESKRTAVFAALASVVPLPHSALVSAQKLHVFKGACESLSDAKTINFLRQDEVDCRTAIYKSIKRNANKNLGLNLAMNDPISENRFKIDWVTAALLPDHHSVDPSEHGLLVWQRRFEERAFPASFDGLRTGAGSIKQLRTGILNWPVNWHTDAYTWGKFTYLCLAEDLWTASRLNRELMADELNGLMTPEFRNDRPGHKAILEGYSKWMSRLSPRLEVWPMSIAAFQWQPNPGQPVLIVFAIDRNRSDVAPIDVKARDSVPIDHAAQGSDATFTTSTGRPPISPIDRLVAPAGLSGRTDTRPSDVELVKRWVAESNCESSERSRRSACEKLLNWAYFKKGKAIASLSSTDFTDFSEFLANPEPSTWWITQKATRRAVADWVPFKEGLKQRSRLTVLTLVTEFFKWLSDKDYADLRFAYERRRLDLGKANIGLTAQAPLPTPKFQSLTEAEWLCVMRFLANHSLPDSLPSEAKLIIELLYYGGLLVPELLNLTDSDIFPPSGTQKYWRIGVVNRKGELRRTVLAPPPLSHSLACWSTARTFFAAGACGNPEPCFDVSAITVHRCIKVIFRKAALAASANGQHVEAKLLTIRTALSIRDAFLTHVTGQVPIRRGYISIDMLAALSANMSARGETPGPAWLRPGSERLWTL